MKKLVIFQNFTDLVKICQKKLNDYQIQGNALQAMGNLLLMNSQNQMQEKFQIQLKLINEGFLDILIGNLNKPEQGWV